MKIYLIGLPGSGKSFLGKQLADEMKLPFIDLDAVVERETRTTIAQLFSEKGEDYFRSLEATTLRQYSKEPDFVMACGGGTPCFHDNIKFMNETGKSIFINTPVEEIVTRMSAEEMQNRPLLAETTPETLEIKLNALLEKRIPFYRSATVTIAHPATVSSVLQQLP